MNVPRMAGPPVIAAMSHLALQVRDLDGAVEMATDVMGMHLVERGPVWTTLRCDQSHHVMQYAAADADAVDHIGLSAASPGALDEVRRRVRERGYEVVAEGPLEAGFADAFAFIGPDAFIYEVGVGMPQLAAPGPTLGVRPLRFGHVNLHVPDVAGASAFYQEVLDFRLSDVIEGRGVFLRANAEHHAAGILEGRGVLHHHAWAVPNVAELARLGDLIDDRGGTLIWGPLRHGAGNNIAVYFADPWGSVVEVYTEMESITDEHGFTVRTWSNDDDRWWSRWTKVRGQGFHDFGVRPAASPLGH